MINNLYIHNNCDIDAKYKKLRLHIALELADANKDWVTFNKIYKCSPEILMSHLKMTKMIRKNKMLINLKRMKLKLLNNKSKKYQ
jgi:hypothetical protein